jgi:DinB superfamily
VTALTPEQIAPLLAATVASLRAEVRALGDEARWQPADGEWSVNECLGHLIEADRRGFAGRIREILAGDEVVLTRWDPPAIAAARHDNEADPIELVEAFAVQRSEGIGLVRSLSAADLARVGLHPEIGPLRVDEILAEWPFHDRSHVRQALAVSQSRLWPQMGATQRFSEPAG